MLHLGATYRSTHFLDLYVEEIRNYMLALEAA